MRRLLASRPDPFVRRIQDRTMVFQAADATRLHREGSGQSRAGQLHLEIENKTQNRLTVEYNVHLKKM